MSDNNEPVALKYGPLLVNGQPGQTFSIDYPSGQLPQKTIAAILLGFIKENCMEPPRGLSYEPTEEFLRECGGFDNLLRVEQDAYRDDIADIIMALEIASGDGSQSWILSDLAPKALRLLADRWEDLG